MDTRNYVSDSATIMPKKPWLAAGEAFGLNMAIRAFDRYAMNEDFARINRHTIPSLHPRHHLIKIAEDGSGYQCMSHQAVGAEGGGAGGRGAGGCRRLVGGAGLCAIDRMAPTAARATSVSLSINEVRAMMVRNGVILTALPPLVFPGKDNLYYREDEIENQFECSHNNRCLSELISISLFSESQMLTIILR